MVRSDGVHQLIRERIMKPHVRLNGCGPPASVTARADQAHSPSKGTTDEHTAGCSCSHRFSPRHDRRDTDGHWPPTL